MYRITHCSFLAACSCGEEASLQRTAVWECSNGGVQRPGEQDEAWCVPEMIWQLSRGGAVRDKDEIGSPPSQSQRKCSCHHVNFRPGQVVCRSG
jgi:hypothetical protein